MSKACLWTLKVLITPRVEVIASLWKTGIVHISCFWERKDLTKVSFLPCQEEFLSLVSGGCFLPPAAHFSSWGAAVPFQTHSHQILGSTGKKDKKQKYRLRLAHRCQNRKWQGGSESATQMVDFQHYICQYLCSNVHLQISRSDLRCSAQEVHIQDLTRLPLLSDPTAMTK